MRPTLALVALTMLGGCDIPAKAAQYKMIQACGCFCVGHGNAALDVKHKCQHEGCTEYWCNCDDGTKKELQ